MTDQPEEPSGDKDLLTQAWGALNFILAFYEPGQTYLDTEAWKVAEARARHVKAALAERVGIKEDRFIDLNYLFMRQLSIAVKESTWIPPEYMVNDWVSDAAEFLRTGKGINDDKLHNLLAVIHRDGGHYTEEHGLEKSVNDAMTLSSERIVLPDDIKYLLECAETHANKLPVPSHILGLCTRIRKAMVSTDPNIPS